VVVGRRRKSDGGINGGGGGGEEGERRWDVIRGKVEGRVVGVGEGKIG
jgi:hypothetical protein